MTTNVPCPDFEAALAANREEMFAAAEEGIANSVEGVDVANVTVYDKQCVAGRLLREIESIARRLSDSTIKIFYVIHLDSQEAQQSGITAETVTTQVVQTASQKITEVFASDDLVEMFNFTLIVTSVTAEAPQEEVVDEEYVPTVTTTSTTEYSELIAPLDDSEGGAAAASAGLVIAVFIVVILCVSVIARFCLMKRKDAREAPKFQTVEAGQAGDLEPQHIVWHLDEISEAPPAPPMEPYEIDEELPTPILPNGTAVEYYSRTHSLWLPGKLEVAMTPGTLMSEPTVAYHIKVNTGGNKVQLRENVAIDSFRAPFAEGEPVEVHSATSKQWIPAIVDGYQGISPALHGYSLEITEEAGESFAGRKLTKVPAVRVRRRFDEGTLVSRYMGPVDGFETGFVDEAAQEEPGPDLDLGPGLTGPAPSTSSVYSSLPPPAAPAGEIQAWDNQFEGVTGKPDRSQEGQIAQWSWVKFSGVDESSTMVVPSYALSPLAEV